MAHEFVTIFIVIFATILLVIILWMCPAENEVRIKYIYQYPKVYILKSPTNQIIGFMRWNGRQFIYSKDGQEWSTKPIRYIWRSEMRF